MDHLEAGMADLLLIPRPSRSLSPSPRKSSPVVNLARCASDRDSQKESRRESISLARQSQIPLCPQLTPSQVYIVRKAWRHINTKGLVSVFRRIFQKTESFCPIVAQTFAYCAASGSGSQLSTPSPHNSSSPNSPNSISPSRRISDAASTSMGGCVRNLWDHSVFLVHLLQRVVDGDPSVVDYLRRIGGRHVSLNGETGFGSRQLEKFGEVFVDVFSKLDGIRESKECSRAWRQLISSFIDYLRDGFEEEARLERRKNSLNNTHARYFDDIERRHSTPARRGSLRIDVQATRKMRSIFLIFAIFLTAQAQDYFLQDGDTSNDRHLSGHESSDQLRKMELKAYIHRMDLLARQREADQRQRKAERDRYYAEYFERMKQYGKVVSEQRYNQLLQKQAQERQQLQKSMRDWHPDGVPDGEDELPEKPIDPFGPANPGTTGSQRSRYHSYTVSRYLPTVRLHCPANQIEAKYRPRCEAYYRDCQQYIRRGDSLYAIAHSFDSGVGLNLGSWAVKGIPYYPVNEEGAIGAGRLMNIPFGSWGGGYSDHIGVRDYWSQYTEIGANWYDGKYGYRSGWSVPLVQSLGVEGESHATVSVPIKEGELGKPIGVDVGGGVGPYYQQNQHVGVDPLGGNVNTNFGVGVPMAGVGVGLGLGIKFPGVADITG
ncbi:unnamed protein product, partial [Mesorhabditis spiculigera]